MSLIQAIALLCITPNGLDWGQLTMKLTQKAQIECQKYFAVCMSKKTKFTEVGVLECINEKPLP